MIVMMTFHYCCCWLPDDDIMIVMTCSIIIIPLWYLLIDIDDMMMAVMMMMIRGIVDVVKLPMMMMWYDDMMAHLLTSLLQAEIILRASIDIDDGIPSWPVVIRARTMTMRGELDPNLLTVMTCDGWLFDIIDDDYWWRVLCPWWCVMTGDDRPPTSNPRYLPASDTCI